MTPIKMSWKEAISIAEIGDIVAYHKPLNPTVITYYVVIHKFASKANLFSLQTNHIIYNYITEYEGKYWSVSSYKIQEKEDFL